MPMDYILSLSKSKVIFVLVLALYCLAYVWINLPADISWLSSDVWGYQFLEMQERYNYWEEVPPSYNQSELYLAFPLLYALNPQLDHGMLGYHFLALTLIISTYLISGFVAYRVFNSWWAAMFVGILVLIPRFIFPTRIGLLDVASVRGNVLALPFYLLLSYYWIMFGLNNKRLNIFLATVAGLLVYLYPPAGIITVGSYVLVAFLTTGFKKMRAVGLFVGVFALISLPFWSNHLLNPNTKMLDGVDQLSSQELEQQSQIIQYKFRGSGFLRTVDFAEVKRAVWDESLLVIVWLVSLGFLLYQPKEFRDSNFGSVTKITSWLVALTGAMIGVVELINYWSIRGGGLPIFIDHLRPMRAVGVALIFQAVAFCWFIWGRRWGKIGSIIVLVVLVVMPIRFFAPAIRFAVRAVVPLELRQKYNLAPTVSPEDTRSFSAMEEIALWARVNLNSSVTKIFLFDDMQNDFRFKVLSRHDTNLTSKEGNLWTTSGYENSLRWYQERQDYVKKVDGANSFGEILDFAKSLGATHLLLPRGKYLDLYLVGRTRLPSLKENQDYKLLKI